MFVFYIEAGNELSFACNLNGIIFFFVNATLVHPTARMEKEMCTPPSDVTLVFAIITLLSV